MLVALTDRARTLPFRVPPTRRGALLAASVVVLPTAVLVALLAGCDDDPAAFPARFDAALATGDARAVAALVTAATRPIVRAAMATAPAGSPLKLTAPGQRTEVVAVRTGTASAVLDVRAGAETRQWVLVREDGAWRLDLMATSSRRPWERAAPLP